MRYAATETEESVAVQRQWRRATFVDLFAGAGFFGHGFSLEGFRQVGAYEMDAAAAAVNALNSKADVRVADLAKCKPQGRCDVLIAGPPCQGFSSMGRRRANDPRNALCMVIPEWAKVTKAGIVVVENVPLFLKSPSWFMMTAAFERLGYESAAWVLNARNYAVAQNRVRSITIYSKRGIPNLLTYRHPHGITVSDAFGGLPAYPLVALQHFSRPQSAFALNRIRRVPYGGDIRDIYRVAPNLVPPSWLKVKNKIIDIWGRLEWEGVSNTIRTGFLNPSRGRFLHPEEDRPITFREAARLQSVPDTFIFSGYAQDMARQIGNGVPVNLARAVARAVKELL